MFYIFIHSDFCFCPSPFSSYRVANSQKGLCKLRGHGQHYGDVGTPRGSSLCCPRVRGGMEGAPSRAWHVAPSELATDCPQQRVRFDFRYLIVHLPSGGLLNSHLFEEFAGENPKPCPSIMSGYMRMRDSDDLGSFGTALQNTPWQLWKAKQLVA